jgi:hypothetical protein
MRDIRTMVQFLQPIILSSSTPWVVRHSSLFWRYESASYRCHRGAANMLGTIFRTRRFPYLERDQLNDTSKCLNYWL